jgi:hypothetical protein
MVPRPGLLGQIDLLQIPNDLWHFSFAAPGQLGQDEVPCEQQAESNDQAYRQNGRHRF